MSPRSSLLKQGPVYQALVFVSIHILVYKIKICLGLCKPGPSKRESFVFSLPSTPPSFKVSWPLLFFLGSMSSLAAPERDDPKMCVKDATSVREEATCVGLVEHRVSAKKPNSQQFLSEWKEAPFSAPRSRWSLGKRGPVLGRRALFEVQCSIISPSLFLSLSKIFGVHPPPPPSLAPVTATAFWLSTRGEEGLGFEKQATLFPRNQCITTKGGGIVRAFP